MDRAQLKTWEDLSRKELDQFREFCQIDDIDMADVNDSKQAVPTITPQQSQNDENNDKVSYYARFALEASTEYPSDLLPCLIVNPPPICKLDRQALMQSIYLQQTKMNQKGSSSIISSSSATILLPRLLPTLRQTLALVWRQIVQQEPNKSLSRFASKRLHKNRRTQSFQKWIIWWASRTEHFDQLVILLEVSLWHNKQNQY